MAITYISITFTGYHWQQTPSEYAKTGWWVVGIIAFNVFVNLIVVLAEIFRGVMRWTKYLYYKYIKTFPKASLK